MDLVTFCKNSSKVQSISRARKAKQVWQSSCDLRDGSFPPLYFLSSFPAAVASLTSAHRTLWHDTRSSPLLSAPLTDLHNVTMSDAALFPRSLKLFTNGNSKYAHDPSWHGERRLPKLLFSMGNLNERNPFGRRASKRIDWIEMGRELLLGSV